MRLVLAFFLILSGLFVLGVAVLGIFRFNHVLNRIHVAAKCDTLGALLFLSGLALLSGWNSTTGKLMLILLFLWLSNPVAAHLIARLEVYTSKDLQEKCEVITHDTV